MPELSIIMPLYNTERYVGLAVQSLLAQSFTDFELIIVNDASTDSSLKIVSSFSDSRIKIINNEHNRGIVFSRNKGLQAATGRYIAPFDSDDIALTSKFRKQIDFLNSNPTFGMVGSWVKLIDGEGNQLKNKWKFNAPPEQIHSILLFRNYFAHSTIVMRRDVIPSDGYLTGFDIVEDYMMWIKIAQEFKVWNYPAYLVFYRIHNFSTFLSNEDLLKRRLSKIQEYSFNFLSINLDKDLLFLLNLINNDELIKDVENLKHIEEFLLLIIKQNKKQKIFDQKQLKLVILNRWIRACYKARYIPLRMAGQFGATLLKLIIK